MQCLRMANVSLFLHMLLIPGRLPHTMHTYNVPDRRVVKDVLSITDTGGDGSPQVHSITVRILIIIKLMI